jgi:long-chain fatty acid transport protein
MICRRTIRLAVLAAVGALPAAALATNGYFPHGYGMKNKAMGGASIALAHDAFGGANNPANMAFVDDRFDIGLDWFNPVRSAERSGAAVASLNGRVESDSEHFFIPEFGFVRRLNPQLTFGVTLYGNGGMNTDYPQGNFNCGGGPANILCGSGRVGVDLMQLIVAPTLAWKFHPQHAVGIAPLFGYQRFKIEGVQSFDNAPGFPPFTGSPGSVTNRGYDSSTGFGVRVGYQGRAGIVSFGAAYAPRMRMSEFDKYKGLFAEQGDFDIPSHYGVGLAVDATPALTFALDYVRINYNEIKSVGNPSTNQAPLGADNGPGFGWQDIDVFKFGIAWRATGAFTLRAGYNHGDNPILARDVTFNILAPGVMQDHYTIGFTYALSPTSELSMSYMRAPKKSVQGPSLFNAFVGPGAAGNEKIEMHQNQLGIGFAMRF